MQQTVVTKVGTNPRSFELEAIQEIRHEFVDGFMFAMAGSTKQHNLIVSNIHARTRIAARATQNCAAYFEEVKVRVPSGHSYYPDIVITCDNDSNDLIIHQPCLIVEVLSESTADIDHG